MLLLAAARQQRCALCRSCPGFKRRQNSTAGNRSRVRLIAVVDAETRLLLFLNVLPHQRCVREERATCTDAHKLVHAPRHALASSTVQSATHVTTGATPYRLHLLYRAFVFDTEQRHHLDGSGGRWCCHRGHLNCHKHSPASLSPTRTVHAHVHPVRLTVVPRACCFRSNKRSVRSWSAFASSSCAF